MGKISLKIGHADLVSHAAKWLRNTIGCRSTVVSELVTASPETPDVIGWRAGFSYLVECKASRGDFLSDHKKHFRRHPQTGMGVFRYYFCVPGLIQPEELPPSWGLAYFTGRVRIIKKAEAQEANFRREVSILTSILRRLNLNLDKALWECLGEDGGNL